MKETSATSKNFHQLSTPIKVNFDICPKISSHNGLQIFYNINFDIGLMVSQRRVRVTGIFF